MESKLISVAEAIEENLISIVEHEHFGKKCRSIIDYDGNPIISEDIGDAPPFQNIQLGMTYDIMYGWHITTVFI